MTVLNERSRVPEVDQAALRRLGAAFDLDGVAAAMLIGSRARGSAGPLSDIDLAVWHRPGLSSPERTRLRLDLLGAAIDALGTEEIDLVMLNGAPPLIRHRAMRDGKRFLDRDPVTRVRLEAHALVEYLDTEPLREQLALGLKKSLREDRFGRPANR